MDGKVNRVVDGVGSERPNLNGEDSVTFGLVDGVLETAAANGFEGEILVED